MTAPKSPADPPPPAPLVIDATRGLQIDRPFPFLRRRMRHTGEFHLTPEITCCPRLLLYVHGYNEHPEIAAGYGEKNLAAGLREHGGDCAVSTFLWPSRFGLFAFRRSVQAANVTAPAFARAVATLHTTCPDTRLHVLAHSLGARVVLKALQQGAQPLHDLALIAPAIANDALEPDGEFGDVPPRVDRILFTHNEADRSLRWFRIQGGRALGLRGFRHPDQMPPNVFAEDLTAAWSPHSNDGGHGAILHPSYWGAFWKRALARGFFG